MKKTDKTDTSAEDLEQRQREEFLKTIAKETAVEATPEKSELQGRMESLLKQAEKYTEFLVSHHQKSSQTKKESKKRGHYEKQENLEDIPPDQSIVLQQQPKNLQNGQLKQYQIISLNWMISLYENKLNGILADDMGLGKTIQTISFIAFLECFKKIKKPHLIIGPKSVLGNWEKEIKKWLPHFKVVKLIATKEERLQILDEIIKPQKFEVCLTSFEGAKICANNLKKIQWQTVTIDEAHKIKNEESVLAKSVRLFKTRFKLLLTGTPLQNNLHELWSLLNFILPDLFTQSDIFDDWFSAQNIQDQQQQQANSEMISQLHKILRPFMLRRTKLEVERFLPPKKQVHLYIGLTELQVKLYKNLLTNRNIEQDDRSAYMNILMQLRKVCNHPYLFPNVEPEGSEILGEHLITSSGKLIVLDKLLNKLYSEKGHQILIFSQMTMVLDILEDYCNLRRYKYCRIDGGTDMTTRDEHINAFTSPDSEKFIFLLSTRAGGLGINLASADTVVIYDSDWNPQMDLQAMDRAHRIGQTKQVSVFRLICENSVEEKIIERQSVKLKWDNLVIQQGGMTTKMKTFHKDEIKNIIQFGASNILKQQKSTYEDEDIEKLLQRGEDKTTHFEKKLDKKFEQQVKGNENNNLSLNSINIYDFLNHKIKEDEEAFNEQQHQGLLELQTLPRNRKNVNYNINAQLQSMMTNVTVQDKQYKIIKLPEHQLHQNREKLQELLQIEANFNPKTEGKENALTQDEQIEKELLQNTGFLNWLKQEFQLFLKGCEIYGRDNYNEIAGYIKTKTEEEVEEYSKVFWERIDTFSDKDKILKQIEKGEKNISNSKQIQNLIDQKTSKYQEPKWELEFNQSIYNKSRSKFFTYENDKFLIYNSASDKVGYGNWTALRKSIKEEEIFRFDHFFKSRSETELKGRMQSLIKILEKERDLIESNLNQFERQKKRENQQNGLASIVEQEQPELNDDKNQVTIQESNSCLILDQNKNDENKEESKQEEKQIKVDSNSQEEVLEKKQKI